MKNSISRKDFIRIVAAGVAAKMCRPAVAHASSTDSSVRFSPEVATEMAHILATSYSNRQDLETEAPVILLDSSGGFRGYSVDFSSQHQSFGYVLFDVAYPGLIAQFQLSEGTNGFLSQVLGNDSASLLSDKEANPAYVVYDPFTYGIVDIQQEQILTSNATLELSSESDISLAASSTSSSWWDTWISYSDAFSSYEVTDPCFSVTLNTVSESFVEQRIQRYACAVHALYAIASSIPNSSYSANLISNPETSLAEYSNIWNATATQVERIGSNGVTYGTTSNNMTGPGFEGYCQSKGLTVTTSTTHSPTFSTFTTHLQKAMPAVVSAGITTKDGPVGHAMPVDGYATLVKNNKTIRCLSIFNGWEDTVFFNYDFSNYTRVSACLVNRSWMR